MEVRVSEVKFLRAPFNNFRTDLNDPTFGSEVMKYLLPVVHERPSDRVEDCLNILEATLRGDFEAREQLLQDVISRSGGTVPAFFKRSRDVVNENVRKAGGSRNSRTRWESWRVHAVGFVERVHQS